MGWPTAAQVRDWLLCLGGVAIAAHETLIATVERPALLVLAAGMMGLPAALAGDRRANGGGGSSGTGSRSPGSRRSRSRR